MRVLRREVELPLRLHRQPSFYLALASLLVSLLIVVDAAVWGGRAAREAAERGRAEARLRALMAEIDAAQREFQRLEQERGTERHEQLMKQLEPPWAVLDLGDPGNRYGRMNETAPPPATSPARPRF